MSASRQFAPRAFCFAALSAYRSVLLFGYWQRYAKYLEIPSVLPIFAPTHSDVVIAHYHLQGGELSESGGFHPLNP